MGGFQAFLDGEPATNFTSDKTRALLAYLVMEAHRSHRRESLCALLWPNVTENAARQSLSQALSIVRKVLRDDDKANPFILADRDTIQFNPHSQFELDHEYHGLFLNGFSLPDAEAFDEWLLLQRETLQREALEKLDKAITLQLEQGHPERAIEFARKQLDIDPWREESHRSLMYAYALHGQRSDALAQFEKCKQVLRDGLGVEPSHETLSLLQRIQQDSILVKSNPPEKASLNVFELPTTLTPFIGRESELMALSNVLTDPTARLITLVGMGGMGKTRLAIEAATRSRDVFKNGVAFIALASIHPSATTEIALARAIASTLRLTVSRSDDTIDDLLGALRHSNMLLILDTFEHLNGADAILFIDKLLQAAPHVKLLVTSREALEAPGEWRCDIHGLGGDARTLFVQCAQRVHANMRLGIDDERAIQRICDLVGGMPLGVELAASWTRTLSCAEIAEEIETGLAFLSANTRQIPERHRSITAVLNHTWSMLTDTERHALTRLAQFRRGFTREAATSVAGTTLSLLSALVNRTLVRRVDARRYDLHELIRQFALERAEDPSADAAAHANYFVSFAAANGYLALPNTHHTRFKEIEYERGNIEAACAHLLATHNSASAAQMLGNLLTRVLFEMYDSAFDVAWVARVREQLAHASQPPPTEVQVQLLAAQMTMLSYSANVTDLSNELQAAIDALRTSTASATHTLAYGLGALAWVRIRQGHVIEATSHFQEAIPYFRHVDDRFGLALGLRGYCLALMSQGEAEKSQRAIEECVMIVRELGDTRLLALALGGLAECERAQGRLHDAAIHYGESAQLFDSVRDSQSLLMCKLNHLGAYLLLGWHRETAALTREIAAMIAHSGVLPHGHNCASALLNFAGSELFVNDSPEQSACLLSAGPAVLARYGSELQPADKRTYDYIHAELARRLADDQLQLHLRNGERRDPETLLRETLQRFNAPTSQSF